MVDFKKVHIFSEERGTGRRLLREHHYVMLSRQGIGRVYLQDGQLYYENGVLVPAGEAEGWGDLIARLPDATKRLLASRRLWLPPCQGDSSPRPSGSMGQTMTRSYA